MLFGGAMGVAKNSPIPALSGIIAACIFRWGPGIILDLMTNGAVLASVA